MSTDSNSLLLCANCGKGEEESDCLKNCVACKMVKYCSRDCQKAHRPQHKKACKKRAAELFEIALFKQPPPPEDCPICLLRLPPTGSGRTYKTCCGELICRGCWFAPEYDHLGNEKNEKKCPFCRTPLHTSDEELIKTIQETCEVR